MAGSILFNDVRREGPQVDERALRIVSALEGIGVAPGDAVALYLRNDIAFLEAVLAIRHLGAFPVPLNWHLTYSELDYIIGDCGARVLFAHTDLPCFEALAQRQGLALLPVSDAAVWDAWTSGYPPHSAEPAAARPSILYTSGTTGKPKAVVRDLPTTQQAERSLRLRRHVYGFSDEVRVLLPTPLYHAAPLLYAQTVIADPASTLVLMDRFDPKTFLRMIAKHRITHSFLVPTLFVRLLNLPQADRAAHDLSSLRGVLHAGAPCPPDIKAAMIDWWGPVLREYYGSTETGPVTFCTSEEWLERPGTVGRAVDGVTLSVRTPEGEPCETGTIGEICAAPWGYSDFTYRHDPEKRAAMQRGDALACDDMGHLDADGYLFVHDRRTDVVISGGVNIYPAEVEGQMMAMPGIDDCAAIGVPDPEYGERLLAVVECSDPAITAADVEAFLEPRLARFKVPRLIEFWKSLPREASGKLAKRRIRDVIIARENGSRDAPILSEVKSR